MSRRPTRPKNDPLASFFRSVYDSLAKKVLEEAADAPAAAEAKPAAERPARRPAAFLKDANEKTIH